MKLPRITVRRLIVAVVIACVGLGAGVSMKRRADRFRSESQRHFWACIDCLSSSWTDRASFHREMSTKYEWSSSYPWMPVRPDPTDGCCCEPAFDGPIAAKDVESKSCRENHVRPRKGAASCCRTAVDEP